ncbi:BREX-2 system adenine-specific DNA-methyltransferase PglX [Natronoglycomyces albus]|uniref:site-specific DNA-methyltransferase (adenine-specific) n=1 Tax=Natronoglycomyces albus TaxID=2811108 RepID=A0A895XH27_9ACTN|nr:BREX-2 system adenine-specific DNA-methyltransferase PglX [Natronoglycomyces albus]QSB05151.1 BREX-2 system adenine-specific DNA-methyltransferase PglX [Natronoglycomyces albus]
MDNKLLLADLKQQVKALEADLLERADEAEFCSTLQNEYAAAKNADRIAVTYETWLDAQVTQAAAAWVLGTVFQRFCEDNRLIEYPYLAASGEARWDIPADRQHEFYGQNPGRDTDRDWILAGFDDMSKASKVAAGLFDQTHNPMWRITPSHHAAKQLVEFWRLRGEDGELVHDFEDPEWDTRFLGDLYQDLSEAARKNFALLQTPEFVEEFILDLTLKPAMDEFGLEPEYPRPDVREDMPKGLRIIDPTCGSGHFLLGAFDRLLKAWQHRAPGAEPWELIRKVLYGIHGVDKNPFAVAIARFRLFVAAMKAAEAKTLKEAPDFPVNIAVGDSLLHGRGATQVQEALNATLEPHTFVTEDIYEERFGNVDLLGRGSYHVVVGNPPYITVKDKRENANYRAAYKDVCKGKYALSVPFAARFFELGVNGRHERVGAGYIGQITANSFMKREFGTELIEKYFNLKVDLTHVIDTSGAYIPGHGTPTVILVGRKSAQRGHDVRVVQGIQGEPSQPTVPSKGVVWSAIVSQIDHPESESKWVSCADLNRGRLAKHPWSLSGGGVDELLRTLSQAENSLSKPRVIRIGIFGMTNADDAMLARKVDWRRRTKSLDLKKRLVLGVEIRDWNISGENFAFFPYRDDLSLVDFNKKFDSYKWMWPYRTVAGNRQTFGKVSYFQECRPWYEWHQIVVDKGAHEFAITYAFVATHNHFVLDRGGKVFKQSAPVIKLPEGATEDDHLELLGLLNSSTACFWLKQVSYPKGGDPVGKDGARVSAEGWDDRYEFTGTKLKEFPLPSKLPLDSGRRLDSLGRELASTEPSALTEVEAPTRTSLDNARAANTSLRRQMIAAQEELDWEVYGLYGLLDEAERASLTTDPEAVPEINLGERAFEIVLARKMKAGEVSTEWFSRHGSTPITEIPSHWPAAYQELVQRRIDCIESRKDIALIERPECKRRWSTTPWEQREQEALRSWLLDACERRELWFAPDHNGIEQPQPLTINQLADKLRDDDDVDSVAKLYAGSDVDLAKVLADIIDTEHVPYLAALRYKDSGLRKRAQWEETWEKQREEDRTGERLDIAVPPKYGTGDFRKTSYWRQRGKLDVPKERFISYPGAAPDNDSSLLIGWAGWDHRQAAHALTMLSHVRSEEGWDSERLRPIFAGLAEQLPWLKQWHDDEVDPELGVTPAQLYADFLSEQQERFELSDADLATWRPLASARSRKSKKKQP